MTPERRRYPSAQVFKPAHAPSRENRMAPIDTTLMEGRPMATLQQRYEIYVEQARKLGWPIKSFDEWLNS